MFYRSLFKIALFAVVVFIGVYLFLYNATYSEGYRAGTIVKISTRGVFFKTNEGQLNVQSFGAVKSPNQFSEVFEFSVEPSDEDVVTQLQEVSLSGERINLRYEERYAKIPWLGETKYFVKEVERIENDQTTPKPAFP